MKAKQLSSNMYTKGSIIIFLVTVNFYNEMILMFDIYTPE